jgi:hypothetical protein
VYEINSVEDAETVDITDALLAAAVGFSPTADQFFNDFRVIRVPVLTADAANEAATSVTILSVTRNGGADGWTVTLSTVADTKFVRIRVVTA